MTRTGLNATTAQDAVELIISGGADVRLFNTGLNYDDVGADLDTKEVDNADYTAVSVAEADWNVTIDTANQELTLTNANEVSFGTASSDWGVVVDAAIHNPGTDQFIIADEVNDPDITGGEDVSFPSGEISYVLG